VGQVEQVFVAADDQDRVREDGAFDDDVIGRVAADAGEGSGGGDPESLFPDVSKGSLHLARRPAEFTGQMTSDFPVDVVAEDDLVLLSCAIDRAFRDSSEFQCRIQTEESMTTLT
jgi:hypothetical protein